MLSKVISCKLIIKKDVNILTLLNEEYRKEEKIDGVIYDMSPSANFRHGIVDGNVYAIVKNGLKDSLCLVFIENLDFKYHPEENDDYVIPDIMIICDRRHLKGGTYSGTPKFVAETLSPSTAMRDMSVKKDIYEKAGVPEYWIISPKERAIQIYYLENGKYVLTNSYILEDEEDNRYYNAKEILTLKEFPHIQMTLEDIFKGVEI